MSSGPRPWASFYGCGMTEPRRPWTKRTANLLLALGCVGAAGALLAVLLLPGGVTYAWIATMALLGFWFWWRKHAPYGSGGPVLHWPGGRPPAGR